MTLLKKRMIQLCLSVVVLFMAIPAQAASSSYYVVLDGASQYPPNASPGSGFARVTFDGVNSMQLELNFDSLSGLTTAAHIHAPTDIPGTGVSGLAMPALTGFPLNVTFGTYSNAFDMALSSSSDSVFLAANGSPETASIDLQNAAADGKAYLNIHTSAFPGGEIRGFLTPITDPYVTSTEPGHAMVDVSVDTNITVGFSTPINNSTVNENTFRVWGKQTGFYTGSYSFGSAVFDPAQDFKPGEEIVVMLNNGIQDSIVGSSLIPHQFEFVAAAGGCKAFGYTPNQTVSAGFAPGIALGDLDGDGDIDAFRAQGQDSANMVMLNDGTGVFTNGQSLGTADSFGAALGDLNNDGYLDVVVANDLYTSVIPTRVLLNNGDGTFTTNQSLGSDNSLSVALGDLDGDNDLDVVTGNIDNQPNRIYLNNGDGTFTTNSQALGASTSLSVKLGDLDGDGDLDLFVANNNSQPNLVYLNNGDGSFVTGQTFAAESSFAVALGDLDVDGDLDAFVVGASGPDRVFTNDGAGFFTDSGQVLAPVGATKGRSVALGDLDGDGDLDAFVVNEGEPDTVWVNEGVGAFSDSGMRLAGGNDKGRQVALGDLDGDGDLDAYVVGQAGFDDHIYENICIPVVTGTAPDPTALDVAVESDVTVEFNTAISNETVNGGTYKVWGKQTGFYTGTYSFGSAVFDPLENFKPGENVVVMLNSGIRSVEGYPLVPYQFEFVAAAKGCAPFAFYDSGQRPGNSMDSHVQALVDLDGDGDLDAWMANSGGPNQVWTNDGAGAFYDSGQRLGDSARSGVLGDLDGDGDLDAFVVTFEQATVWTNDGPGTFYDSGQRLGDNSIDNGQSGALGDLDGDGDLDAFVVSDGAPDTVWTNDGTGTFFDSGQRLGSGTINNGRSGSLGDLDADGDLDAFVVNRGERDTVWMNDGTGTFYDSGQRLGGNSIDDGRSGALGDLDGDGDLDAFVVTFDQATVWTNDGDGAFFDSGQRLGESPSFGLSGALGDVDGDGDLDALLVSESAPDSLWLNNGAGTFSDSGQRLGEWTNRGRSGALGDLDGDGDLDAFVAGGVDIIWFNQNCFNKDEDAFTDYEEYVAGTDHTDANDFFGIGSFNVLGAGTNEISWDSVADRLYRVERSYDLPDSNAWEEVYGPVWQPSPMVFTNNAGTNAAAFYRLRVE